MNFSKLSDTRAIFKYNDLKNFLGIEKAENFIYTYRRAIKPIGSDLVIKTCNFLELVINYKKGEI